MLNIILSALSLTLNFALRFPPTIFGNPIPPYTGFCNGPALVFMKGENASLLRLSYLLSKEIEHSNLALDIDVGLARFTLIDMSRTIPVFMAGMKYRHDYGIVAGAFSLKFGFPEGVSTAFDIGIESHGKEVVTFRFGGISGVSIHSYRFDLALIMNLFATNLDFFAPPSLGISLGWRLQ